MTDDRQTLAWCKEWLASFQHTNLLIPADRDKLVDVVGRVVELANEAVLARNEQQTTKIKMAGSWPSDGDTYREHEAVIDGDDIYVTDDVASDLVDHVAAVNAMGPSMIGFDTPTAWLKLDEAIVMVTAGTSRQGVILIEQVIVAEPSDDHWHLLTRPFAWEKVDPT